MRRSCHDEHSWHSARPQKSSFVRVKKRTIHLSRASLVASFSDVVSIGSRASFSPEWIEMELICFVTSHGTQGRLFASPHHKTIEHHLESNTIFTATLSNMDNMGTPPFRRA